MHRSDVTPSGHEGLVGLCTRPKRPPPNRTEPDHVGLCPKPWDRGLVPTFLGPDLDVAVQSFGPTYKITIEKPKIYIFYAESACTYEYFAFNLSFISVRSLNSSEHGYFFVRDIYSRISAETASVIRFLRKCCFY